MSSSSPPDLPSLARHLLDNGPRKTAPASRRVRVIFNHTYIVDTLKTFATFVWEHDYYPQYYVPLLALQNCEIISKTAIKSTAGLHGASILTLKVAGPKGATARTSDRVISFEDDKDVAGPLAGLVRLEFGSFDQWFEETVPIYVHPKDPFKRVDILPSTKQITVKLDGTTLASTNYSLHLHETGLPTRYYIPYTEVNVAFLRTSDLITKCPYKGDAEYFHVAVDGNEYKNLIWWYRLPTPESAPVAGHLCFYNEKVDIEIDGKLQERPKTKFG